MAMEAAVLVPRAKVTHYEEDNDVDTFYYKGKGQYERRDYEEDEEEEDDEEGEYDDEVAGDQGEARAKVQVQEPIKSSSLPEESVQDAAIGSEKVNTTKEGEVGPPSAHIAETSHTYSVQTSATVAGIEGHDKTNAKNGTFVGQTDGLNDEANDESANGKPEKIISLRVRPVESVQGVRFDDEVAEEEDEEDGEVEEKAMDVQKDSVDGLTNYKVRQDISGDSGAGATEFEPKEVIKEEDEEMDGTADEKLGGEDDHATLYGQGLRVRQDAGDAADFVANEEVKEKHSTPQVVDQTVVHSQATKLETTSKSLNPGATAVKKIIPSDIDDDDETAMARPKGFRRVLGHFVCGCQHRAV